MWTGNWRSRGEKPPLQKPPQSTCAGFGCPYLTPWLKICSERRARGLILAYERGRLGCIALCASIRAALPRELCDMIYDQLVTPGTEHHVMETRDEDGNLRTSTNPLVRMSFFDPQPRIPENPASRRDCWRYSEYTGNDFGKEIAECWYRTSKFVLYAEDDLFERFLTTDVWEREVVPADAVRHIRVVMPRVSDYPVDRFVRRQVLRNLQLLRRISNKKTKIFIQMPAGHNYPHERIQLALHPRVITPTRSPGLYTCL